MLFRPLILRLLASIAAPATPLPMPDGTGISASFPTDGEKKLAHLIDGDPQTVMIGGPNSAPTPTTPNSVYLRFPKPLANLGGVVTGESDIYANYYPIEMEFWADSNGDGRYDTKLGATRKLGPGKESAGERSSDGRLPGFHGLEILETGDSSQGQKRAFQMSEIGLIRSDSLPLSKATPNSHRRINFKRPIPAGTKTRSSSETDEGKGAEVLLDGDRNTYLQHAQGAAHDGKLPSRFLTFPEPRSDLAGIELGRSEVHGNYVWQSMSVYADTTGDGDYDTLVGSFSGPGEGDRRFASLPTKTYGLELRVTKEKITGSRRSFAMNEIPALLFADEAGDELMRYVLEDFASWWTYRCRISSRRMEKREKRQGKMRISMFQTGV